ncbi:phenylalanine--tRNA ligase subunit beta [Zavarzinia sp. CC-PAN008]|uniref:phenylalanine--tRNA ligase subunit beta n=1 Tax=Zavarzinia sp. CC-PAN008 TaxID=3243332 RepID=UPI003F745B16
MKTTLAWLKEHLDTDASLAQVTERLTDLGLEVEGIEDRAAALRPFVVAKVIEAVPHPNADRLRVCRVDAGQGEVQVVCGAPNARTGMTAVFAPSGSLIPGTGAVLKPGVIRGVESNGMLVSEREMGLSEEHDGIIDLETDAPIGTPFAQVMGLDDPVFDVKVLANRPDCLGVTGLARDLAAGGLGTVRDRAAEAVPGSFPCPVGVHLDFPDDAKAACPLFVGRMIRGVKNGPSPDWLQRRLRAIGLRPISTLVDITNFMTFDRGRPLHVFDAAKLKGDLRLRLGREGDVVLGLDGKEHALGPDTVVICDDTGPVSIGGIMGGETTGVDEATVDVLVESALFDPVLIATGGRRLNLSSDARYRFERGVDPASAGPGIELATRMILDLCGGTPSDVVVAGEVPRATRIQTFRPERFAEMMGFDLSHGTMARILADLGFHAMRDEAVWRVAVPSWRRDVVGEADLVEEIGRVHGFAAIPSTPLTRVTQEIQPSLTPAQRRVRQARRALAARGLVEAVSYSFVSAQEAAPFAAGTSPVVLVNPISADLDTMRPSLLASLIPAAARNQARGNRDIALFEVAHLYRGDRPEDQIAVAGGLRVAQVQRHWQGAGQPLDVFSAKADVLALLAELGLPAGQVQVQADAPSWYHPGRSGQVKLGPKTVLAQFGELHPRLAKAFDVSGTVVAFEVFLAAIPFPKAKGKARPELGLSDYQAVERDFAFVLKDEVTAEAVLRAVRGADKQLIADAQVFDVYRGPGLADGTKSLAIAVRLEPRSATLTEAEIEAVSARIVAAVAKATGGTLRSQ